jgi:phosphopantetheine adenylyltransferase
MYGNIPFNLINAHKLTFSFSDKIYAVNLFHNHSKKYAISFIERKDICFKNTLTFQINQPTRCNNFSSLLLDNLCTAQHVSGVLMPTIRSSTTAVAASGFTVGAW